MEKVINSDSVRSALASLGWDQKQLAAELDVTGQAVTNWMKGKDFPRPKTLLKLAKKLELGFDQLVLQTREQPIVAFRKKAGSITTDKHLTNASSMGSLLKPLIKYLPKSTTLRTQIQAPSLEYEKLQEAATEVRKKIGIGSTAVLDYLQLISEFNNNGAVIIPVMWGNKQNHGNALHILLPEEKVTFIYLNLDTYTEDFKFWMAHELAHVYTPDLAGSNEGEDFADAFAGALLFPKEIAKKIYSACAKSQSKSREINLLTKFAKLHEISLYSVYCEVIKYASAEKLPSLKVTKNDIHAIRNKVRGSLVSKALFSPTAPDAAKYIAASNAVFKSNFFNSLKIMLKDLGTGSGYVQQLLDISLKDAKALHKELVS
ncbi:MAG: helix-turn-helix domain-containing protein [Methylophilaceae bacterium]